MVTVAGNLQIDTGTVERIEASSPSTDRIAHAEMLAEGLFRRLQEIDVALGSRDHRDFRGRRLDGHAYFRWRSEATAERADVIALYRRLKQWIKSARTTAITKERVRADEKRRAVMGTRTPRDLVRGLYDILQSWEDSWWDELQPHEQDIVRAAAYYLDTPEDTAVQA